MGFTSPAALVCSTHELKGGAATVLQAHWSPSLRQTTRPAGADAIRGNAQTTRPLGTLGAWAACPRRRQPS